MTISLNVLLGAIVTAGVLVQGYISHRQGTLLEQAEVLLELKAKHIANLTNNRQNMVRLMEEMHNDLKFLHEHKFSEYMEMKTERIR